MLEHQRTLGISLLILFLVGCATPVNDRPIQLEMIAPTAAALDEEWTPELGIRSAGKVVLSDEFNLSFPISGQIVEIIVGEGDFVQAGDVIARLDTTTLRAEIAESEGELAVSQAELARVMAGPHESVIAEAEIEATAIALQPAETITETTTLVSEMAASQARLDYLLAQPLPEDVAVAQAKVTQAQLNVDAKRAQLRLASIVAPADGTVIRVLLNDHEYARVGETVVQMSNLNRLSVQTEMYDFELVGISIGDTATITFDALPGFEVEGSVYSIVPDEAEARGGRYIVMMRLSEIPDGLRWGMTARVVILEE